jgi:hypothetical protein
MIGCYTVGGETRFLPVSRMDMERAAEPFSRVLQSFDLKPRRYVLSISRSREAAQVIPFERAAVAANLIVCNADNTIFEAGRVESFLRRFDIAAVAGLSVEILDGLANAGFDAHKLLQGKIVWARNGAYERLAGLSGIVLRRWIEIGPVLAIECVEGAGVHIDADEWQIGQQAGEIHLTNRLPRAESFDAVATGIVARLISQPCRCGNADPRVELK